VETWLASEGVDKGSERLARRWFGDGSEIAETGRNASTSTWIPWLSIVSLPRFSCGIASFTRLHATHLTNSFPGHHHRNPFILPRHAQQDKLRHLRRLSSCTLPQSQPHTAHQHGRTVDQHTASPRIPRRHLPRRTMVLQQAHRDRHASSTQPRPSTHKPRANRSNRTNVPATQ
jgi:hypothetical protein